MPTPPCEPPPRHRLKPQQNKAPTPAPSDVVRAPYTSQFGKYVRTVKLGDGGMGEVWKAWDTELCRWVAMKFLKGIDPEEIARFNREAHTAGRLNHPNIAAIYDVGEHRGRQWIAMQLIPGTTLKTFPRVNRRLLVELVRDTAAALQAAHDENIIHRDIKPENLMVVAREKTHHLFVMDFGLARPAAGASDFSVSGLVVGTPSYMSPEQTRGERADARADIWSLGATLYELITDRKPFQAKSLLELLKLVQEQDPKPPRRIDPTIDADLETIVLKCLEKDRTARYASARELAGDLERWLEGEPIAARPISGFEKAVRQVRRNKALSATLAALFTVAVAGSAVLFTQHRRATADLAAATHQRIEGEKRLKQLSVLWMQVIEKKRDLRGLKVPPEKAWPALEESVHAIDGFIRRNPELPQGWYLRALGNLYLERHAEALADAEQAVGRAPDFKMARRLRGMIRIGQAQSLKIGTKRSRTDRGRLEGILLEQAAGDFREAGSTAEIALEGERWGLSPSSEDEVLEGLQEAIHRSLMRKDAPGAEALLRAKAGERKAEEYATALGLMGCGNGRGEEWISRAIEWAPGYAFAWYVRGVWKYGRGDCAGAMADYAEALKLNPRYAEVYYSRGSVRQLLGDHAGAIEEYTEAIRIRPDYAEVWVSRAHARGAVGELALSIEDCDQALRLNPGMADAYCTRAETLRVKGDTEAAFQDLNRFIELDPNYAPAFINRGLIRYFRGDVGPGLADIEEALRIDPQTEDGFLNRGKIRMEMGELVGATSDFDKAILVNPKSHPAWFCRGHAYRLRREFPAALKDFNEALRLAPESADTRIDRGLVRQQLGDVKGAVEDYTTAIGTRPTDPIPYSNRGSARRALGDIDGAIADLDEALRLDPRLAEALSNRGAIRRQLGDRDGALADLLKALEVLPAGSSLRAEIEQRVRELSERRPAE